MGSEPQMTAPYWLRPLVKRRQSADAAGIDSRAERVFIAACAAASLATGTRYGEQLT